MASVEICAFGRRLILVSQFDKLEDDTEEEDEEPEGPAHYIPTPMEVRTEALGYRLVGPDHAFEREVN